MLQSERDKCLRMRDGGVGAFWQADGVRCRSLKVGNVTWDRGSQRFERRERGC